jgi:NADH-quinone oxidoreductase chain G
MPDPVNVTIDDKQVAVPQGTLVVDAAKAAGIDIPVFCSHPKLDPLGACRMCLVEFVGPRGSRLDTACTVRVSEGMVVRTDTEQVRAVREANLSFILLNHPLDCPICDKGGECPLQDQTMEYGPGVSKFIEPKRRKQKHYPISDLIMLDQERCILCWRCIRYLEEWEDKPQLGLFERGGETIIDVFPDHPVDAKTSGNIIDICPVGALTNRVSRFRYRPWELHKTPSVCTLCSVGCNLRLDERVHELRRVVARENLAVNNEWICDKGRFLHQHVDHAERLTQPMIREDGQLRPASWEEAMGRVVDGLDTAIEAGGVRAAGGIASARVSNEAAYLFQKLFRALLGNNNVDYPDGSAVSALPGGLPAIAEIGKSDVIVLVGLDPSEAAPLLDVMLKRAVLRAGAALVIIHPRRIALTRYADHDRAKKGAFLPARPGAESLAINGVASLILGQPAAARQREDAEGWADLREIKPKAVAEGSNVGLDDMKAAAALLAGAKTPLFIYGPEAARGERGRATAVALHNLALLLGHADRVGYVGADGNSQGARDVGLLPGVLPGGQPLSEAAARKALGQIWGAEPPTEPGLTYTEMVAGGVRALYVMGDNPAALPAAAEALRKLDFLVVQDLFLTETAQLADVVLPAVSFAEADSSYTNLERRVQRAPQGIQPAGEGRADWAILADLAGRWLAAEPEPALAASKTAAGRAPAKPAAPRSRVRSGATPTPWDYGNAAAVLAEIGQAVPAYAGLNWEALGEQGMPWPAPAAAAEPAPVLEVAPVAPRPGGGYWLVSGPLLWDDGTFMHYGAEPVRNLAPAPFIALNPADLRADNLRENCEVTVRSPYATLRLMLRLDSAVEPGTAWAPLALAGRPAETLGAGRGEPVAVTIR